jgi:hypothetical protein
MPQLGISRICRSIPAFDSRKPPFPSIFAENSVSTQAIRRSADERLANLRRIVQNE